MPLHKISKFLITTLLSFFVIPNIYLSSASADGTYTWTERTTLGSHFWNSITSSSDGSRIAIADTNDGGGGYLYTSSDYGVTWETQTAAGMRLWVSIAASGDGAKLVAAVDSGYIYTSSDYGVTWETRTAAGTGSWTSVASSSDGSKLAAVKSGGSSGYIYTSSDYGVTWETQTAAGSRAWASVASSSDGSKLAAAVSQGYIFTSADSGSNWDTGSSFSGKQWYSIASSSDGTKLAAADVDNDGYIYTSADSGSTWETQTAAYAENGWYSVTSNSTGSKLAAVAFDGANVNNIYTSSDYGVTWETQTVTSGGPDNYFKLIVSNSDGTRLVALAENGNIWTGVLVTTSASSSTPAVDVGSAPIPTVLVSYLGNGVAAQSLPNSFRANHNTNVQISNQPPSRTGYTFLNWNNAASGSGTKYQPGDQLSLATADVNLYAQWKINSYTLTFEFNSDSLINRDPVTMEYSTVVKLSSLLDDLTQVGYTFLVWNSDVSGNGRNYSINDTFTFPAANSTLYAMWKINNYVISYDSNGSKIGRVPSASTQAYKTTLEVKAPSKIFKKTGYTFQGWNNARDGSGESFLVGDTVTIGAADQILYAHWFPNTYEIRFINTSKSTLANGNFTTGSLIELPEAPPVREGFKFKGWSSSPSKKQIISFPYDPGVYRNITLYAVWVKN